jgi:RNA polymerase sigma-70 factor, ECF subfamily
MPKAILQSKFNAIYETHADSIFRFCLVRVSSRDQALDLTQETFMRLWQTLSEGKTMTNDRAFLFTVAHRLIIDWYRKKKPLSLEEQLLDPSNGDGQYEHELGAEGRYILEKIAELDDSYRHAVYLRFVEDLQPSEIATILDISTNAASVRINRGIEKLRELTGYKKT